MVFYDQDSSALLSRNLLYHNVSIPSHNETTAFPNVKAVFNNPFYVAIKC